MRHIVDPKTEEWFHLDDKYNVWSCDCTESGMKVSLCLSQCSHLIDEGELRNIKRQIAQKKKELGILPNQNETK